MFSHLTRLVYYVFHQIYYHGLFLSHRQITHLTVADLFDKTARSCNELADIDTGTFLYFSVIGFNIILHMCHYVFKVFICHRWKIICFTFKKLGQSFYFRVFLCPRWKIICFTFGQKFQFLCISIISSSPTLDSYYALAATRFAKSPYIFSLSIPAKRILLRILLNVLEFV